MSVMSLKIPAIRASSVGPVKASLTHLWPGDIETEGPAVGWQSHSGPGWSTINGQSVESLCSDWFDHDNSSPLP